MVAVTADAQRGEELPDDTERTGDSPGGWEEEMGRRRKYNNDYRIFMENKPRRV